MKTLEQWRSLAAGATTNCTPEQLDAIAKQSYEAEHKGENYAIWHSASVVFGTLDRCPCVPCSKARGER
jgi:hypothetical protein